MGNIMGSNVANIGLVLGITAVFYPIHFSFVKIRYDLYFLIGITLLLLKFISMGNLILWQGVLFLLLLFSYCIYLLRANQFTNEDNKILITEKNYFLWIKIVLGMIGLAFGSSIFIIGATGIAKILGISPLIIGMSIVALGTSLPELTTSLAAARHGETDFIIGNIIGSNIMNIIAVLGISILFRPIHTNFSDVAIQGLFMTIFVLSLFFLLKWKNGITKLSGIILMIIYALFLYFNFHGI
jgi:cation:H+ antiporter